MNGVQTRFKCKLDVKRCKRFVFPPSSLLPRSNALKTKAIRYFQTDRTLTRIVSPPLHKDIAFKFASWISVEFELYSVEFELYIVKEFQRLKEQEQAQLGWSAKRELSKINYHIHTDAIKQHLIPQEITSQQTSMIYASEADVLNVAMFGMTALEWRDTHPDLKGNIRDYASINELICLSNMEN